MYQLLPIYTAGWSLLILAGRNINPECHCKLICLLPFGPSIPPGLLAANTASYICNHSTLYTKISKEAHYSYSQLISNWFCNVLGQLYYLRKQQSFRGLFSGFLAFYNEMNKSDEIYFCIVILFDKKSLTQLEIDNRDIYCWWCFISCANKNLLQHELYALQKGLFECLFYLCRERCSFWT